MGDPLSVASGIAGLLSLAGSILGKCYSYGCGFSSAPDEAKTLAKILTDLNGALVCLQSLASGSGAAATNDRVHKMIEDCNCTLNRVNAHFQLKAPLADQETLRRHINCLVWPLRRRETLAMVEMLERQKSTLNMEIGVLTAGLVATQSDAIDGITKRLTETALAASSSSASRDRIKLLEWLSSYEYDEMHTRTRALVQQDTGQWIFETEHYRCWRNSTPSLLWLYGISGSGKTVLASTIIEQLRMETLLADSVVAYFYCDGSDAESLNLETILGSLLRQICLKRNELTPEIERAYEAAADSSGRRAKPTLNQLERLLFSCIKHTHGKSYIIIVDGLDESNHKVDLCEIFKRLISERACSVKVLVSSQPESEIKSAFSVNPQLSVQSVGQRRDIELYIDDRLQSVPRLRNIGGDVKNTIARELKSNAHDMFRWVQCQVDEISRSRTLASIERALKVLPSSLEETYDRIMARILPSDLPMAQRALVWLLVAVKPLRLGELAEATILEYPLVNGSNDGYNKASVSGSPLSSSPKRLISDVGENIDSHIHIDHKARLCDPTDILEILTSLVSFDEAEGKVHLAHPSVRSYLANTRDRRFSVQPDVAHEEVAVLCMKYLSMHIPDHKTSADILLTYPLLRYAAMYWPVHVRLSNAETRLLRSIRTLLSSKPSPTFHRWMCILRVGTSPNEHYMPGRWAEQDSPAYHAVSHGLIKTTEAMVTAGIDLNGRYGSRHGTLLHAAVWTDRPAIVQMLLNHEADYTMKDENGYTAFNLCEHNENNEIIDIFRNAQKTPPPLPQSECRKCAIGQPCKMTHSRRVALADNLEVSQNHEQEELQSALVNLADRHQHCRH